MTQVQHGQKFGNWRFNAKHLTLDLYNGDEIDGYYVDLEEISNSAQMLDWIFQISGKQNRKDNVVDLIEAFDAIFQPQKTLCPGGESHAIENIGEFLESRAEK